MPKRSYKVSITPEAAKGSPSVTIRIPGGASFVLEPGEVKEFSMTPDAAAVMSCVYGVWVEDATAEPKKTKRRKKKNTAIAPPIEGDS